VEVGGLFSPPAIELLIKTARVVNNWKEARKKQCITYRELKHGQSSIVREEGYGGELKGSGDEWWLW